ncbi:unnamed protein product [Lactuca virosa]|uniref:Protein kinase domain-containing protein n=1 Tax=Lactuca virosa TaxID=75947 RepID=A0AAU9MZH7_9ASTR|nr:unnamed protein product [Lactuca virosa]
MKNSATLYRHFRNNRRKMMVSRRIHPCHHHRINNNPYMKKELIRGKIDTYHVLCGRPALDFTLDEEQHSLAVWARDCIEEGKIDRIIDPSLRGQTTASCLNEFAQIAYECMLSSSKNRPTMTKVVARLEFVLALGSQKHGGVTIAEKVWALFSIPVHAKNYRSRQKWSNDNKSKRIILGKAMTEENNNEGKDNGMTLVHPTKTASEGSNENINKSVTMLKEQSSSSQMATQKLMIFTLDELWRATGKFLPPPILGVSDRVSVYKGWVTSASYTPSAFDVPEAIMIKNLNTNVAKNRDKWQAEVEYMGKFSHPNVVKLLGYGWGSNEIHLVYEYSEKGSLYMHLFGKDAEPLPWDKRIKIALGAAQGLAFMHTEMYVICRDVRSSNILLDGEFNAKITDFGEGGFNPVSGESPTSYNDGYVAPEYLATGVTLTKAMILQLTTGWLYLKSDVYGFGVVMLEIVTGLRAVGSVETSLSIESCNESSSTHHDTDYRPSMEKVVARLEEINSIKIIPETC